MAFLGNDAVNRVNLHYAIQALAAGAGGVFFLAFLLHDGVSVAATLATFAAILAGRFALRPLVLPLAKRWGLKPIVIIGSVGMALDYPLLAAVHGVGPPLAVLAAVSSASSTCYWPAYHAYFAAIGDAEHRGHQIGAREALAAVVGIVAPLVGGWLLVTAGPWWTFSGVAVIQAASAIPLIGAPNVPVAQSAPGALRAALPGLARFAIDGWFGAGFYYVWQVLLFVSLGSSLTAFGGAMALAALAGAVIGLALGRHIDRGGGRRATVIAYMVGAAVVAMRAASLDTPWLAVTANAAGALVVGFMAPAMMTAVYNLAKASPCPYRFHIATEGAWDAGCAGGVLVAAALAAAGAPMAFAILAALPATAIAAWLLWRYYGAHPAAGGVEPRPLLAGEPGAKNPHEAYFFYYNDNELQAVMSGHWKLYLPHTFRTLAGQSGGRDGKPVAYQQRTLDKPELYDVDADIGEMRDVAAEHPEVVARLLALAEKSREDLGDSLVKRIGKGVREPGRVDGGTNP